MSLPAAPALAHAVIRGPMRFRRRRRALSVAVLGLAAALGGLWWGVLRDRVVAKRWGVVEPGAIYRSGQLSRFLVQPVLLQHGIREVIDLTEPDASDADQLAEQQAIRELSITVHRFPLVGDGTGDIRRYALAIAALDAARRAGRPVLVHCHAGSQRTGGVVAAYRLLVERRRTESEALAELCRFGWRPGRDHVLLEFLNQNWDELARLLVELEVIESVPQPLPRLEP